MARVFRRLPTAGRASIVEALEIVQAALDLIVGRSDAGTSAK